MRVEILAVGTELLLGQIANTNARWMSESLAAIGADVLHHQVVGDNLERIVEAMRLSAGRADVVIVTGGLGPTQDDITRDALAVVMGAPMVRHPELEDLLREKFRSFGRREMPESNLRQADVPEGARVPHPVERDGARLGRGSPGRDADLRRAGCPGGDGGDDGGHDPARARRARRGSPWCDPGAPLRRDGRIGPRRACRRPVLGGPANPTIAFLASSGEVKVRITAKAATTEAAERLIEPVAEEVLRRLGDVVFTTDDETLEAAVVRLLAAGSDARVCRVDHGGGVGARITSVPGASEVFVGSAVVYRNEARRRC